MDVGFGCVRSSIVGTDVRSSNKQQAEQQQTARVEESYSMDEM